MSQLSCLNIKHSNVCQKMQYLIQCMCPMSDPGFVDDGGSKADYDDLTSILKNNSPLNLYSILIRYYH